VRRSGDGYHPGVIGEPPSGPRGDAEYDPYRTFERQEPAPPSGPLPAAPGSRPTGPRLIATVLLGLLGIGLGLFRLQLLLQRPAQTQTPAPPSAASDAYNAGLVQALRTAPVGSCATDNDPADPFSAVVVGCTTRHAAELLQEYELPAGPYPGTAAMSPDAGQRCTAALPADLGAELRAALTVTYALPRYEEWLAGDRAVRCVVISKTLPLSEPLRPAGSLAPTSTS
jgi:Septum formation